MADRCRLLRYLVFLSLSYGVLSEGMLYPRDSESRLVKTLDGVWNFRADKSTGRNQSFVEQWWTQSLSAAGEVIPMPVPSSYNFITNDKSLRDFVGWVWYDRTFFVPADWQTEKVMLRIGSANYNTIVWVNGQQVMSHEGGHLPFESEISSVVSFSAVNRVTVAVNNTLTPTTLPPGTVQFQTNTRKYPEGYFVQNLQMDHFNYAGIHRHVHLYIRPTVYVDDITIVSAIVDQNGSAAGEVTYNVTVGGKAPGEVVLVEVTVEDGDGHVVSSPSNRFQDTIVIPDARLWWPWTMNPGDPGFMYTLKVNASGDVYRQPFGIRTVQVTDGNFLINDRPFYCHGVGRHEDSDIRGKGMDYPLTARDFSIFKWLGVNCFRSTVYPNADEFMDQADQQGFVVLLESPGTGIVRHENFGPVSLAHHKEVMGEMVRKDKNRPSVIMWFVANEPSSDFPEAEGYFRDLIAHTRSLDEAGRPVAFITDKEYTNDVAAQFSDVICLNRYYSWYSDMGHTEVVGLQLSTELEGWRARHKKPIIITEYGADTISGLHREPSLTFTEEYQTDFMKEYHKVFDKYRSQFLIGELSWVFADFMTVQDIKRVVGNRKGVLTRQRQPKASGHLIRQRYHSLINNMAISLPVS